MNHINYRVPENVSSVSKMFQHIKACEIYIRTLINSATKYLEHIWTLGVSIRNNGEKFP